MTTEIAKQEKNALVLAPSTDLAGYDYGDENKHDPAVRRADYAKPVLNLLNGQSPYLVDPEHKVKGAEAGMFYDPSTGNLYDGKAGFPMLLVHMIESFDEWLPRKDRKDGTKGTPFEDGRKKGRSLSPDDPLVAPAIALARKLSKLNKDDKNYRKWYDRRFLDTGNDMIETVVLYGLVVRKQDPLIFDPILFPLSSTKLQSWRDYRSKQVRYVNPITGKTPPFCSHLVKVSAVPGKDAEGNNYYTTIFKPYFDDDLGKSLIPPASPLFAEAVKFRKEIVENHLWRLDELDVDISADEAQGGDTSATPEMPMADPDDDPLAPGPKKGGALF